MNTQATNQVFPSTDRRVWRVIFGAASCLCSTAQLPEVCPAIQTKPGAQGGQLRVEPTEHTIDTVGATLPAYAIDVPGVSDVKRAKPITPIVTPIATPFSGSSQGAGVPVASPGSWEDRGHSDAGAERAKRDQAAAKANGFSLGQELFAVGSLLYGVGVDNARRERMAWEALPSAEQVCTDGIKRIQGEGRRDENVPLASLAMSPDGALSRVRYEQQSNGSSKIVAADRIGLIDPNAYAQLAARMGIPADSRCTSAHPAVRSPMFNAWATGRAHPKGEKPEGDLVLRTRRVNQQGSDVREVFAAVSEKYGALDVDLLLRATEIAIRNEGGRATFDYDGKRSQLRVIWHSNIAPEECVVGEILQAWAGWSSDDTGGGSIKISGGLFHVLCKNLGHALPTSQIASIRHIGDVNKLAREFARGFGKAKAAIQHYVKAWNVATADDLRTHETFADPDVQGLTIPEFMAATFRGLLMSDRIVAAALPTTPKNREATVKDLVRMWERDDSSATKRVGPTSVAAVTNAFTRYAHEVESDPWQAEEIERAGSSLLFDRDLPWALPDATEDDIARG